ncbi:MAG: hypothetical protein WCF55_24470, partial [Pseudolabrys sp.]
TSGFFTMPSSLDCPAQPESDLQAEQIREFDQWRKAVELTQRMREAGFVCDLWIGVENRH